MVAWIDEVKASMLVQGSEGMKHARQQKGRHKSFTVQTHGSQPQPHCGPIATYFSTTDPWGAVGGRSRRKNRVKSLPTSQGWRDGNRLWWSRNSEQEKLPEGSR